MDLSNRSSQPAANPGQPFSGNPVPSRHGKEKAVKKYQWYRIAIVAALAAVVILLVALTIFVAANNTNTKDTESTYVNTSKLQAVFLNTGQVYFGNVKSMNSNYVVLTNIFYLQTSGGSSTSSSTSSNSNVSLVKLGCELHQPFDQMVINRTQVTFWENLEPTGQVAKAVTSWQSQHPNGQNCAQQTSAAPTSSGTSTQSAGSAKP